MRILLESSWMKFGPAGRGTYDWVTGAPPPSVEKQLQGYHWNELSPDEGTKSEIIAYIILPTASLLFIGFLAFLAYRKFSHSKLALANVIALDMNDAEGNAEFLSSLNCDVEQFSRSSSDTSDGVFLMVYLPPPYEETLTKITRATSSSSAKDMESMKMEDLEARLCPETNSSGCYV
ncbi:small integral membrane protein 28-like [Anguilla anguilla]|uniref:small integral membrane protein 28-like n=1 Tax=Anguilla anguilla TaxID=7936 RepID=UPI0015AA122C|nr:small integral membrane protein 28-like [Anguilla anguilla]